MRLTTLLGLLPLIRASVDVEEIPTLDIILADNEAVVNTTETEAPPPRWQCDIRAWSRSPDISSGTHLPADARLSLNGTECDQVVKWEAGVRFIERAIIKKIAPGVTLPVKPVRPPHNETRSRMTDWNDIYGTRETIMMWDPEGEYSQALDDYYLQMRNESLWFVKAEERTVFDLVQEFALPETRGDYIDVTDNFAIHVPDTNFPPMELWSHSGSPFGKSSETLNTETLAEHYHLVHLINGTVLDIPSGRLGFVPAPEPVAGPESDLSIREVKWPVEVDLESPRHDEEVAEDEDEDDMWRWMREEVKGPSCDAGNKANFVISVKSNITQPILGQNMTFDIVVKRYGNGSEYPAFVDIGHGSEHNITWAYNFISNETEYEALQGRPRGRWGFGRAERRSMLALPSEAELKRRKEEMEQMEEEGVVACCGRMSAFNQWPGDNMARYEILSKSDYEPQEEYRFSVEIAIAHNDFPSFATTFEEFKSKLTVTINTVFLCDLKPLPKDSELVEGDGQSELERKGDLGFMAVDKEWREYVLPLKKSKKRYDLQGMRHILQHSTSLPLNVRMPPSSDATSKSIKHYTDPKALGIVLSRNVDDQVTYPLLNQELVPEVGELKRVKWDGWEGVRRMGWCYHRSDNERARDCYESNKGGGGNHAASMWRSKVENIKEREEKARAKQEPPTSFVVQA